MNNPIVVPMCVSLSDVEYSLEMSSNMEELEPEVASAFILNGRVTGVKGSAESDYRTGDVNLSPADLGIDTSVFALRTDLPTKTSDLTNDSGYIKGQNVPSYESDPTVPSWAKQPTKPSYTASEVGALPSSTAIPSRTSQLTNDSGYISGDQVPNNETDPTVPQWAKAPTKPSYTAADVNAVPTDRKVNGKELSADISLTASDVGALPSSTSIPSATSDLTNDSGFITAQDLPTKVSDLTNDVPFAKANNDGASLSTMAIPFGYVDSTSTSTVFTATVEGITELKTGVCVMLHNGVATSAAGFTININGLGAKKSYNNLTNATQDTTIFNVAYTMLFIYDETLDSGNGGWWCYRGYDANTNTIGYQLRTNSMSLPMQSVTYRYRILFTDMEGTHFVPPTNSSSTNATATRTVNQAPIDPFGRIVYYGTTASVAAGSRPAAAQLWQQYTATLGYSFNRTGAALTLTAWKPVYVKCAPQSDGSAIIDATTPFVQDLPTTEDGFIYIFLGVAYSATAIELTLEHPVKWYKDGAIRNYFG